MGRKFFIRKVIVKKTNHPRCHYTRKINKWKPKVPYETQQDADEFLRIHRLKDYKSYECSLCGKWHIGYAGNNN